MILEKEYLNSFHGFQEKTGYEISHYKPDSKFNIF